MESEQEALKAIRSLNGHVLNGNRLNVEVIVSILICPIPYCEHLDLSNSIFVDVIILLSCLAHDNSFLYRINNVCCVEQQFLQGI